jgi:hypothetical protein
MTQTATQANWYQDPTGRHQLRYHDGNAWTEHVSDNGATSTDPVDAPAPVEEKQKFSWTKPLAEQPKAVAKREAKAAEAIAAGARPDVEAAKAKMRIKLGAGRELKKLPDHLFADETVEVLSSGRYGNKQGLLALTSHRLIFLVSGLASEQFEDFPVANISSIAFKGGMVMGSIEVYASGNKAIIENVNKLDAKEIADAVRERINRPAPATTVQAAPSDADELAKFAALRDQGVITAEDFEAKKRQLLGL